MSRQLVPEQLNQHAHRIKSNLINTDKDINTSRACLLSASKFLAMTQQQISLIQTLPSASTFILDHYKQTTSTPHQHSSHMNRTSRDSSEQPFLRLHQSSFNEQHHQQRINSSQTEARISIHQLLSRLGPAKEFSEYLTERNFCR